MTEPYESADDDLSLARTPADAADAISMSRFGPLDLRMETKPDATPVIDADQAVERQLRDLLGRRRPGDSVLGEEYGRARAARAARAHAAVPEPGGGHGHRGRRPQWCW